MSPGLTAITTRSEPLTSSRFEVATATPVSLARRLTADGMASAIEIRSTMAGSALIQPLTMAEPMFPVPMRPIRLMLMTG